MRLIRQIFLPLVAALAAPAQNTPAPALTIYNQDFAVVRQQVRLDLKSGVNNVRFDGTTAQLEPDSVVLRDPNGKRTLQILEQNYQADPVSQQSLLELFEGKTIDFQVTRGDKIDTVPGRIVRPGSACYQRTTQGCAPEEPLIEIGGKLQFGLPGRPLFPALPQDTNLKPTLDWILDADGGGASRRRTQLCDKRHDVGSRLQHHCPTQWRCARSGRMGHDGEPHRQDI